MPTSEEGEAPMTTLTKTDAGYLRMAIDLSRHALDDQGKTPFGAILVLDNEIVSEGTTASLNSVDPTAHAEVMAIRNAARELGRHLLPGSVLYCSSEPCPLCLVACYSAQVSRLVFGATSHDVATYGFEDLQLYRQFATDLERRSLPEVSADEPIRRLATDVLRKWAEDLPEPVHFRSI